MLVDERVGDSGIKRQGEVSLARERLGKRRVIVRYGKVGDVEWVERMGKGIEASSINRRECVVLYARHASR